MLFPSKFVSLSLMLFTKTVISAPVPVRQGVIEFGPGINSTIAPPPPTIPIKNLAESLEGNGTDSPGPEIPIPPCLRQAVQNLFAQNGTTADFQNLLHAGCRDNTASTTTAVSTSVPSPYILPDTFPVTLPKGGFHIGTVVTRRKAHHSVNITDIEQAIIQEEEENPDSFDLADGVVRTTVAESQVPSTTTVESQVPSTPAAATPAPTPTVHATSGGFRIFNNRRAFSDLSDDEVNQLREYINAVLKTSTN
ncbi:hypothetical protein B0H10DRAFT_2033343 [Mycena sp. CBHHK59/15]|nr:hypothetical protein B0H10DRAFT_2033343 [Mycena sp. CBHHK59/15]